MRLRINVRRPGRYREDDLEELPPNPQFVVPTIAFNPNLRPAVFPTLRWDELPPDHPSLTDQAEEREVNLQERREEGVEEASEQTVEMSERPAVVFRDTRMAPIMEQEEGLMQLSDDTWVATEEPGEYDAFAGSWNEELEDHSQERWFPLVSATCFPALIRFITNRISGIHPTKILV
jgi:hypothetical protein